MTRTSFEYRLSLSSKTTAARLLSAPASSLRRYDNVIICAYVQSNVLPICQFFISELGTNDVRKNLPKISPTEILLIRRHRLSTNMLKWLLRWCKSGKDKWRCYKFYFSEVRVVNMFLSSKFDKNYHYFQSLTW